ncbi:MAG: hypothetical protein HXY30_00230 [Pseudorhodoplanes sp.]|nr:hypothetical protein [Pseudorhodoplanes sp.]
MTSIFRNPWAIAVLAVGFAAFGPAAAQDPYGVQSTQQLSPEPKKAAQPKPKPQKAAQQPKKPAQEPQKAAQDKPKQPTASTESRQSNVPSSKLAQPEEQGGDEFKLNTKDVLRVPKGGLKPNQFTVEYVQPKEPKHFVIHDMMKEKKLLEKFQAFLAPIHLPNQVKLQIAGCDGRANANFWQNTITVCYEYFEFIWAHTPKMAKAGLSPRDAMIGPTVDVFLHEAGHAILQLLDIPLLAREEDAADYIATFLMLEFCPEDARRLILGASFISGSEAMAEQGKAPELAALADVHSLPAVRYFNRWCMAYGKDPVLFADAMELGMLTRQRAKHCSYEYSYISDAFKRLIHPYVDAEMVKQVKAKKWFQFETPFAEVVARPADSPQAPENTPSAKR